MDEKKAKAKNKMKKLCRIQFKKERTAMKKMKKILTENEQLKYIVLRALSWF